MTNTGGFEPRSNPAERRAQFDLRRRITELQDEIDALEVSGWRPIGSGDETSLTITVPTGVDRVRVFWSGANSVTAFLDARINADTTGSLHVMSSSAITTAGAFTSVDGVAGTVYRPGDFLGILASWGSFEIDCSHPRCWQSGTSYRQGIPAGSVRYESYGWLDADRTVTSIQMLVSAGTLSSFGWLAEGYYP